MFRLSQHPSSGVLKTVSAIFGIGHDTGTATSFHRGLMRPRWKEVAVPVSWPIPEVADTVFNTPDDGCCDTRNMYSDCAVNKCLHTVASSWTSLLTLNHDAWKHEFKKKIKNYLFAIRVLWTFPLLSSCVCIKNDIIYRSEIKRAFLHTCGTVPWRVVEVKLWVL